MINKHEAPKGYIAVATPPYSDNDNWSCIGCAFQHKHRNCRLEFGKISCMSNRKDKCDVIFKKDTTTQRVKKLPTTRQMWFYVWTGNSPYLSHYSAQTREELKEFLEYEFDAPWRKTYRRGGRMVKCDVTVQEGQI